MRTMALVILLFVQTSAVSAGDEQKDGQMWGTSTSVPNPLPAGYPSCIKAVYDPEWQEFYEAKIDIFYPPISENLAQALNSIRNKKHAVLKRCNLSDS